MLTANTKVTAKEVLKEVGIINTDIFGTTRIRIGGIAGINDPERIINISPEAKTLEVIVGADLYELELSKGNKDDNAEIPTFSKDAKKVSEAKGKEATQKAEHIQKVKVLARKIRQAEDDGFEYTPTKEDKEILDEANEKAVADRESIKQAKATRPAPIKIKSK